jgi:GTP cyclohydrolase I
MDKEKLETSIGTFLKGLGVNVDDPAMARTPSRVARAWADELVSGYQTDPAEVLTWTAVGGPCEMILLRGVSFTSICMHHLLPFSGTASLAYIPVERQAGLSKLGRVVDAHARRLQTQEALTSGIVGTIDTVLQPKGVLVLLEAEHTCMTIRGVRKKGSRMLTMASAGCYSSDPALRAEVITLLSGSTNPTAS